MNILFFTGKNFLKKFVTIPIVLLTIWITVNSQYVVWYEDFDENSDGVTMYAGAVGWDRDLQGASVSGHFEVRNHKYEAHYVNSEVLWISELINIKYLQNVSIYVDLASEGVLEYTDSVNVYYRVDDGSPIQLQDAKHHGNFSTVTATASNISGSKLQIIAHFRNEASGEIFTLDNVFITAEDIVMPDSLVWYETFDLTDGTFIDNGTSAWSRDVSGTSIGSLGCFDVRLYRLLARDLNGEAVWTSETIDISGHQSVDIAADIYSYGLMNNCDYIKIFYKLDGGAETLLTNGEINSTASDIVTAYANGLSGSTVQFVARVLNNSKDEHHMLDNVLVKVSSTDLQVTATGGKITCVDSTVTLNATASISGVTYSWSGPNGFTSTLQNPVVTDTGVYTLTVTNPENSSTAEDTTMVILNITEPGAFASTDGFITCINNTVTLLGSSATPGVSYSWEGPEGFNSTVQNPEVGTTGMYTLTVTNPANGCTSVAITDVEKDTIAPDVNATVSDTLTCTTTSVILSGNSATSGVSYSWSGPGGFSSNEQNPSVGVAGIYTLTVADPDNGCTNSQSVEVIGSGQIEASISISGYLTCTDISVMLYGNSNVPGASYFWSDGYSTALSQNVEVTMPGMYWLTVTDSSTGCYAEDSIELIRDITSPGALTEVSGQLSCTNPMVTLSGSSSTSNVTYNWSGPEGFSSNEQNPMVNTVGTYTLTVTNPVNGCAGTSSVEVTASSSGTSSSFWLEDFSLPDGTTVDNGPTSWSLQNTAPGTFSVQDNEFMISFDYANEGIWLSEVVDISTKSDIDIIVDVRSATASSSEHFESTDYMKIYYKLDGGDETLIYEDHAGLGTTTNTPQHFTVVAGYYNGSTIQVIIKARNSNSNEYYYIESVKLKGTVQAMDTITTSVSGSITCQYPNVQLTASVDDPTATYYWIDPDNITINQQNPVVNKAGNYTVVVSTDGCQTAKTVTVTGSTDIPDVSVSGYHLECNSNDPVVLNAISSNTNLTYSWTGPEGFTSNEKNPSVLNAGTYNVIVTDQINLCTNTDSFDVKFRLLLWDEGFDDLADGTIEDLGNTAWSIDNSLMHTVDLSDYTSETGMPYYFEVKDNKLAARSTRGEVVWTSSPIDISGVENVFALLDISGAGSLNDSSNCGIDCYNYDYVQVFYKVDGGTETLFENLGSIPGVLALSGLKASSNIPDGDSLQIIIKAYNTANNELFYFDNIQVVALGQEGEPVTLSVSGIITCEDSIVTLTASPNIVGNEYNWTGPGGFTSDEPVVDVDQPGMYTLIIEVNTGCVTSDTVSIEVIQDIDPPDLSIDPAGTLTCITSTVGLNAVSSTLNTLFSWNGADPGENPVFVSSPGIYIVTATNNDNGCTKQDSVTVAQDNIPPVAIALVNDTITCSISSVLLSASSPTPGVSYRWIGPEGYSSTQQNTVTSIPGEYILSVTNPLNGCISADTVIVQQDKAAPEDVTAIVSDTLTCTQTSVTLTGTSSTSGVTYNWLGPDGFSSTEQNPVVSNTGIYNLVVTDPGNGCSSSASVFVEQDTTHPSDVLATVSGILTCADTTVTLTGSSSSGGVTYSWLDPNSSVLTDNPVTVSIPGTYILTVTNINNGCSKSANVIVEQDIEAPAGLTASVSDTLSCTVTNVILSASSTTSGVTYHWIGPEGFISDEQYTVTSIPGIYTVMATDPVSGCSLITSVIVIEEECQ